MKQLGYDIHTEAAADLDDILEEIDDRYITDKVNQHLCDFYEKLSAMKCVTQYRVYFMTHILHDTQNIVEKYGYPEKVETFLLNLITAIFRRKMNSDKD